MRPGNPDARRIFSSGVDLRGFNLENLHLRMSFAFQSFGCYQGTVAERTSLGNRRELPGRPDRIVRIEEWIGTWTEGLNALLQAVERHIRGPSP